MQCILPNMLLWLGKIKKGCYTENMRKLQDQAPNRKAPQYGRRKRRKTGSIWINLAIVLCLGVMAFCGYQIYSTYAERAAGKELNAQMEQYVQYTPVFAQQGSAVESCEPELQVDFSALQQKNSDICGWIFLEDSQINYPVVQGSDNSYYLSHTASGDINSCGAIFMDCTNDCALADAKTILYGHRMNNGTMFAGLLEYREQSYYEEHPYLLLAVPEQTYVLQVFAAREVADDLDNYRLSFTSREDFMADIQMLTQGSLIQTGVQVSAEDQVVMLSTCVRGNHAKRFVVLAKLVPYEEYNFT